MRTLEHDSSSQIHSSAQVAAQSFCSMNGIAGYGFLGGLAQEAWRTVRATLDDLLRQPCPEALILGPTLITLPYDPLQTGNRIVNRIPRSQYKVLTNSNIIGLDNQF